MGDRIEHVRAEMTKVVFTSNIQRHVACPEAEAAGAYRARGSGERLRGEPAALGYVVDHQSALRRAYDVFVDGQLIRDRASLRPTVLFGRRYARAWTRKVSNGRTVVPISRASIRSASTRATPRVLPRRRRQGRSGSQDGRAQVIPVLGREVVEGQQRRRGP